MMMHANDKGKEIDELGLSAENLAKIIKMAKEGDISGLAAKEVLAEHLENGKDPKTIVEEKGLEQVSDENALDAIVDSVISENERSVKNYKEGKVNALSFMVGQVMKKTNGKANPKLAGEMLLKKIKKQKG